MKRNAFGSLRSRVKWLAFAEDWPRFFPSYGLMIISAATCMFSSQTPITMASLRTPGAALITSQLCRQCARTLSRRPIVQQAGRVYFSQQPRLFKQPYNLEHGEIKTDYKLPPLDTKVYKYDQVRELSESPSSERILIGRRTVQYRWTID